MTSNWFWPMRTIIIKHWQCLQQSLSPAPSPLSSVPCPMSYVPCPAIPAAHCFAPWSRVSWRAVAAAAGRRPAVRWFPFAGCRRTRSSPGTWASAGRHWSDPASAPAAVPAAASPDRPRPSPPAAAPGCGTAPAGERGGEGVTTGRCTRLWYGACRGEGRVGFTTGRCTRLWYGACRGEGRGGGHHRPLHQAVVRRLPGRGEGRGSPPAAAPGCSTAPVRERGGEGSPPAAAPGCGTAPAGEREPWFS